MAIGTKPPAEVAIDLALVQALIQEQHADLAHLALNDIGEGWDNAFANPGAVPHRPPRLRVSVVVVHHIVVSGSECSTCAAARPFDGGCHSRSVSSSAPSTRP